MHVLFVVGKFPDLTFIFRTTTMQALRGHQITVAARQRGNWQLFNKYLPLPTGFRVTYLLPDTGLSNPYRFLAVMVGVGLMAGRSPVAAFRLFALCWHHTNKPKDACLIFMRHVPFIAIRADIIHYDFPMTAALYPLLPQLMNAPTVVSCRGSDLHLIQERSSAEKQLRLNVLDTATVLHCVSDEMVATIKHINGRTANVWVNRPAIPVEEIKPKSVYSTNHTPTIIWVGRLDWIKGLDYLLEALARLKREGIAFKARLIGDGDLYAVLRFSVEDLNLIPEVEFTGKLPPDRVLACLQQADVFVLSSHNEGISNAVLEAMAAGLPVVTTAAGGMSEAVRDGIEGWVVPIRDIPALTERLKCLLLNPRLREQMGRAARVRIETEFSLARQASVFEQIYQTAVEQTVHASPVFTNQH
ncbi:MAG: glycosyltransferase family 4 protein [Anaerolineae bacterium]|nr:glycosyltransferase family 4 protein [Anaerolineae bacterium]